MVPTVVLVGTAVNECLTMHTGRHTGHKCTTCREYKREKSIWVYLEKDMYRAARRRFESELRELRLTPERCASEVCPTLNVSVFV